MYGMHISELYYKTQLWSDEFRYVTNHIDSFPQISEGKLQYYHITKFSLLIHAKNKCTTLCLFSTSPQAHYNRQPILIVKARK